MFHNTKIANIQYGPSQFHTFECRDEKGRTMGAEIKIGTADFVPAEDYRSQQAEGSYLWMRPGGTRNGCGFGPTQPRQYFKAEAERDAAIAIYLSGARKRAEKRGAR